jgi:predicted MFS family arabinose efflux permease
MAIERRTVILMSVTCAFSVANIYYCQPLLAEMGRSLGVSDRAIGYLPMWTQAGTAAGMFIFVPLGDMFPRHKLILLVCSVGALMPALMALAPTLALANAAGFATGLTASTSHLVLPLAAKLAPAARRGHVVGTIMAGLLLGILLARVVSGTLGEAVGWRFVYWMAAVAMASLAILLRFALPHDWPEVRLGYGELLRSIARLVWSQPVLREAAVSGAMLFGAFSSFWTTLVFFLGTPPYHYGAKAAGLFGLAGVAGALLAPRAGRFADRKGPGFTVALAILTMIAGYLVFDVAGHSIAGLIAGVIVLDLGMQAGHVGNLTRIYALVPEARSRLNTVYMVSYFLGGSIGSALGAFGWSRWGWSGVCAAGIAQLLVALGARAWVHFRHVRVRTQPAPEPSPV